MLPIKILMHILYNIITHQCFISSEPLHACHSCLLQADMNLSAYRNKLKLIALSLGILELVYEFKFQTDMCTHLTSNGPELS